MLLPRNLFIQVPGGDNFGHIYLDFLLTIIIFYIFSNFKFIYKLIIVLGITILVEMLQTLTTRNFSYQDLLYNFLGIYIAIIVIYFFIISKNKKI
jgi:VanZ family protein